MDLGSNVSDMIWDPLERSTIYALTTHEVYFLVDNVVFDGVLFSINGNLWM